MPSIGKMARRILGPRLFSVVGNAYIRLFGDYAKVAPPTFARIPADAYVVDVGGGDGVPLNYLLAERPDVRVAMIDISQSVGTALRAEYNDRVTQMPSTSIRCYLELGGKAPDAIIVLDVMHHIPPSERPAFLRDLHELSRADRPVPIIFKDVEPGSISAKLNELADRYISGDKNVSPIGIGSLTSLLRSEFGEAAVIEASALFSIEPPHYSITLIANPVESLNMHANFASDGCF